MTTPVRQHTTALGGLALPGEIDFSTAPVDIYCPCGALANLSYRIIQVVMLPATEQTVIYGWRGDNVVCDACREQCRRDHAMGVLVIKV